ncbi:MAG: hypothetical protein Q8R32_00795, partial [bacterium]|nr:hypothetical protein [bacterium]
PEGTLLEVSSPSPAATTIPSPTALEPLVSVSTQAAGTSVTVDKAMLAKNGFIAIHTDDKGKPGPVIGNSALLKPGPNTAIAVKLSRRTRNGETLYAMLHTDVNGNGVYEFPGADVPTTDSTGAVIAPSFTIGTASSSPSPSPSASPSPASGSTKSNTKY